MPQQREINILTTRQRTQPKIRRQRIFHAESPLVIEHDDRRLGQADAAIKRDTSAVKRRQILDVRQLLDYGFDTAVGCVAAEPA